MSLFCSLEFSLPQYQKGFLRKCCTQQYTVQLYNYALCLLVGAALGERNVAALIVIFVDFVICD